MAEPKSIIDQWLRVEVPPPPQLQPVVLDPATTALLVLDIQTGNCNPQTRPRCQATLPHVARLLHSARSAGAVVAYSLTRGASPADIRAEVAPLPGETVVTASVDKFFRTGLEEVLSAHGVQAVIVTGTSAHGAVLHTATGAAMRGMRVVVPVDCMSSDDPFAELYTAWHMLNAPGTRRQSTLTRSDMVEFQTQEG